MTMESPIFIERRLLDELTRLSVDELPRQAYGLIGGSDRMGRSPPRQTYLFISVLVFSASSFLL